MNEPLSEKEAEKLAQLILRAGDVAFPKHAKDEMEDDNLSDVDVKNVLRGGFFESVDYIDGSWRYRFCTQKIVVVIAFRSKSELVIVTTWRT